MSEALGPRVEPYLSAAFALVANPGAYALLLGAGVSVSAGVPSTWGVQKLLLEQLAAAQGADSEDAFAWFREKYGKESTYDDLLDALTHGQAERQGLLRPLFEPTEEERADGLKTPSVAHHAIARLVARGLVRVILTINFDRLMEAALLAAGVEPTVVSSAADLAGMAPLHAQRCIVVHLHGDYLHPAAMLNTAEELGEYPPEVESLLDQVFGEYGLVIAGWSATWDTALRQAVTRNSRRFYATYWVEPGQLSNTAEDLRALRRAELVLATADSFFGAVTDACDAILDTGKRHPLTAPIAVATAKRALSGVTVAIPVHDTLQQELERIRVTPALTTTDFGHHSEPERVRRRLEIEAALEVPLALVATVAYWGDEGSDEWWFGDVQRFAVRPYLSGDSQLINLQLLPATAMIHAAGIASVASRRAATTVRLLTEPETTDNRGDRVNAATFLTPGFTLSLQRSHRHLVELLRPLFVEALGLSPTTFRGAAERFEYLRLVHGAYGSLLSARRTHEAAADAHAVGLAEQKGDLAKVNGERVDAERRRAERRNLVRVDSPYLLVVDRDNYYRAPTSDDLEAELRREGEKHPLLAAGFCTGDYGGVVTAMQAVDDAVNERAQQAVFARLSPGVAAFVPREFYADEAG